MSAPNSQPGFQLHPWISGNLGVFDASYGFLSQIPACSSIPLWNCWEHTFPGILAWIGNGTWEYPTPKAALVTSHKFFPKGKKKGRRDSPCSHWGHLDIPTSQSRIWRGISSSPAASHSQCTSPASFPIFQPFPVCVTAQGFYGIINPIPRAH